MTDTTKQASEEQIAMLRENAAVIRRTIATHSNVHEQHFVTALREAEAIEVVLAELEAYRKAFREPVGCVGGFVGNCPDIAQLHLYHGEAGKPAPGTPLAADPFAAQEEKRV